MTGPDGLTVQSSSASFRALWMAVMELSALAKEAVRVTAMETELTRSWLLVGKMVMSGWEISLRRVGWMEATKGETTLTEEYDMEDPHQAAEAIIRLAGRTGIDNTG